MALKGAAPGFDGARRGRPLAARRRARRGRRPLGHRARRATSSRPDAHGLGRMPMTGGVRLALLAAIAASSLLAAPRAAAHELEHRPQRLARPSSPVADIAGDRRDRRRRAAGTEDQGLPLTWCGTERTTDDIVHNATFPPRRRSSRSSTPTRADRAEPLRRLEGRAAGRRVADRRASWAPSPAAARRRGSTWARLRAAVRRHPGRGAAAAPRATYANDLDRAQGRRRAAGARRRSGSRAT